MSYLLSISKLALRLNRYCATTNIEVAYKLHLQIWEIALSILEICPPEWKELIKYFSDFPFKFHSFVSMQEKGKIEPTRMAIVRLYRKIDLLNEGQDFYFFPFGRN